VNKDFTECSDCGTELEEQEQVRQPCPNCGGTRRTAHVSITERAQATVSVEGTKVDPVSDRRASTWR